MRTYKMHDAPKSKKASFTLDYYKMVHGKNPRGMGSWAFCPDVLAERDNYLEWTQFSPYMDFQEAKKWASENEFLRSWNKLAVLG